MATGRPPGPILNQRAQPQFRSGGGRFAVGARARGPIGLAPSELLAKVHPLPPTPSLVLPPPSARKGFLDSQLHTLIDGVMGAVSWAEANRFGRLILGGESFNLGVYFGMVENPARSVLGLLDLGKTFILADIYDELTQPLWKSFAPFRPHLLGPGTALFGRVLVKMNPHSLEFLKRSAEARDGIVKELTEVMLHPLDYLGKLPDKLKAEYSQKWQSFQALFARSDLKSQFEAGRIFGNVLMEVLITIASIVSGVGAAAKVAAKVPQLLRWAGVLTKVEEGAAVVRTASAVGKGADAVKAAEEAQALKAPKPKPAPAEAKPPKPKPAEPVEKPPQFKPPVAAELKEVEVNGIKPVRVRQGTNGKVAVIGRNMKYVEGHGSEFSKMGYDTELFTGKNIPDGVLDDWMAATEDGTKRLSDAEAMNTRMWQANTEWAEKLHTEGYTVVDMGNPGGAGPSAFYNMECETIFGGASP